MKSKLVFRIFGALASALIIVSVFIPFISVTGYSTSLWQTFESTKSLYLPIMIIVFGAIGVIFFAINFKTEFAYMSTGAILFFLVMQTFDVLKQDAFGTLSVGYYCLAIGSVLTGMMAFLANLKSKAKEKAVDAPTAAIAETSVINKIDTLYNDQLSSHNEMGVQPLEATIQPLQSNLSNNISVIGPSIDNSNLNINSELAPSSFNNSPMNQPTNLVAQEFSQPVQPVAPVMQEVTPEVQPMNPVAQEFSQPVQPVAPVAQEVTPEVQPMNPVAQEFSQPVQPATPVMQEVTPEVQPNNTLIEGESTVTASNPTIQEFSKEMNNNYEFISMVNNNEVDDANLNEKDSSQPAVINNSEQVNPNKPISVGVDIFGQPINK